MTHVTLILDTFDPDKPKPPLKEYEMPWGRIGNLLFKIETRTKPGSAIGEIGIAQRAEDFLVSFMMEFWHNYNTR